MKGKRRVVVVVIVVVINTRSRMRDRGGPGVHPCKQR